MSTPARSRRTAVVCRIVCGLTRFVAIDNTVLLARSVYCVTSRWMPNRVNGWLPRFKKTASLLSRLTTSRDSDVAVAGHSGQVRNLFPFPCRRQSAQPSFKSKRPIRHVGADHRYSLTAPGQTFGLDPSLRARMVENGLTAARYYDRTVLAGRMLSILRTCHQPDAIGVHRRSRSKSAL